MNITQKWNAYKGMTRRNILLFFKDKATLFFSMLAPLIVLFLYIVFLKSTYVDGIENDLGALKDVVSHADIDSLTNAWLIAGILGTSCVTVSLNSLTVMVSDKEKKIDYDYNSSPISGPIVVFSYFTGAFFNTFFISGGILTIGLIVLSLIGNLYLTAVNVVNLYLITILGCASSTILMMVVVSFFKKSSALGSFSGIVSAAIGFVIGAYVPLGNFSKVTQTIMNCIPGSHIACLYRQQFMNGILNHIDEGIGGIDEGQFVESCRRLFALNLNMFDHSVPMYVMFIYVASVTLVGLVINCLLYRTSSKRYN